MMGEWLVPNVGVLLADVLDSPAFGVPEDRRAALAVALAETGFVLSSAYYVPDIDELFGVYRQLAEAEYHSYGQLRRDSMRWVMCGETHLALYRKYKSTRVARTPAIDWFLAGNDEITDALVDDVCMMITMSAAASVPAALDAGSLCGMGIRRDPAARRPMFELVTP